MKKALNESTIANELRGASAFFSGPRNLGNPSEQRNEQPIARSEDRTVRRSVDRSESLADHVTKPLTQMGGENVLSVISELQEGTLAQKRATERYAFEIYTDQKRRINRIRYLYEEKTGIKLSASRMLREAIEPYLKELEEHLSKL